MTARAAKNPSEMPCNSFKKHRQNGFGTISCWSTGTTCETRSPEKSSWLLEEPGNKQSLFMSLPVLVLVKRLCPPQANNFKRQEQHRTVHYGISSRWIFTVISWHCHHLHQVGVTWGLFLRPMHSHNRVTRFNHAQLHRLLESF